MTIETASFPEIELVRTGRWNGLNGETEITEADLSDAVAAYRDRELDRGKLRFGHRSTLNEELGDGAPAYGWIENLKLSDDGKALIGDIVDVPRQLAGLIGRAYKQRSVEMRRNVTTPSGKKYKAALTGLALLGASAPAVKGMEDIAALYASENPDGIDDDATQESIEAIELSGDVLIPTSRGERGDTGGKDPGEARENQQEEPVMAYPKSTLDALGLPEDATEEQVNEAIAAKAAAPEPEESAPVADAPRAEEKAPGSDVALSDLVEEYRGQVTALSEQLATVRKAQQERDVAELMEKAKREGRFAPDTAKRLVEKFGNDFAVLSEVVETHAPGTINVIESGSDVALSAQDVDDFDSIAARYAADNGL